jgi:hypothetical protein
MLLPVKGGDGKERSFFQNKTKLFGAATLLYLSRSKKGES